MSSNSKWYFRDRTKVQGPFSEAELQLLAKSGKISTECQFARDEGSKKVWLDIAAIPGLAELIDIDGRKFLMLNSGTNAIANVDKSPRRQSPTPDSQAAPSLFSAGNLLGVSANVFAILAFVFCQRFGIVIACGLFATLLGACGFVVAASSRGRGIRISLVGIILGIVGLLLGIALFVWNSVQ